MDIKRLEHKAIILNIECPVCQNEMVRQKVVIRWLTCNNEKCSLFGVMFKIPTVDLNPDPWATREAGTWQGLEGE